MEVVFKLTSEQLARAKAVVKEVELENYDSEDRNLQWCGNLLGWCWHSFSFNSNQWLELNEDAGVVTYKGERHPLVQDGGLTILYKIAAGEIPKFPAYSHEVEQRPAWYKGQTEAVSRLKVVLYKTSDSRLKWWETMDELAARMSPEELLEELVSGKKTRWWSTPIGIQWVVREYVQKYAEVQAGTSAYRRMLAEGRQLEWKIAQAGKTQT